MATDLIRYGSAFVGLLLLQVLVLNHLELSYYINPYIYPLIIIMLPFRISQAALMFIAFVCGLALDVFSNTMGMHAAALVAVAFFRPYVISAITPKTGYEIADKPGIRVFGFTWYLAYSGILLLIHHLIYFYLEIFSFSNAFSTLVKVLLSEVFSLLFAILLAYLFSKEKRRM